MEKRPRILIIEDNRALVEMLSIFLKEQAYEVLGAYTGRDGIRQAQQEQPDLVLLDIHLPDINGYDVAQELRARTRTQHIPIIFLTEARDRVSRLKGLRLGADDYIVKPFDLQELGLRIRNALDIARRVHQFQVPTHLPAWPLLAQALEERMRQHRPWALLGVFLQNFHTFRNRYGSLTAEDALRAIGKLLLYIQHQMEGAEEDLVSQLEDDFAILTEPGRLPAYQSAIRQIVIPKIPYFYSWEDREHLQAPQLMRIHMRTLTWQEGPFTRAHQALAALGVPLAVSEDEA